MNRRQFIKAAGVTGLGLAAGKWLAAAEASQAAQPATRPLSRSRPNLLYIFTDQQFAAAMSCAGNQWVKTPNMDRLAAGGVRFDLAYTTHPICSPARASMLTGLMPHQNGVTGNGLPISDALQPQSMGWWFKRSGYRCAYAGKGHLPSYSRLEPTYGFEILSAAGDRVTTAACVDSLAHKQEAPFLLVASFVQPHDICDLVHVDEPARGRVFRDPAKIPLAQLTDHCPPLPANFNPPTSIPGAAGRVATGKWSPQQWRHYLYGYYRYVEEADAHLGEILQALRDSGQEDNTLIVFSSDHGDGLGAHHTSGKNLLYEEMARVPFILSFKGRIAPGQVDREHLLSTGLDLLPTLCDYAGIAAPAGLSGRSLRPLAEGDASASAAWRDQVVVECGGDNGGGPDGINVPGRMLRTKQFKYTVYSNTPAPASPLRQNMPPRPHPEKPNSAAHVPMAAGQERLEELFDLQNDPGETRNLAGEAKFAETLQAHRQRLARWCQETGDSTWKA